jgi:hypothetical protein
MSIAVLNLVIPRGVDFVHSIELRHGLILVNDLLPGATSIKIRPLPIDLPANFELSFPISNGGSINLITTAIAPAGATTVPVQAYTGVSKLAWGVIAQTLPQDLTGQVWRGQVRRGYHDMDPLVSLDFVLNPLNGLVTIKAPKAKTLLLPPNAIYSDLPSTNLNKESSFTPALWQQSYFWDAEYSLPTGEVFRAFNGRVWVTWEATR